MSKSLKFALVAIAVVALCAAGTGFAQTTKTELRTVTIVGVSGNTVYFTNAKGESKEYAVPPGMKLMQDGKEITVAELKPGMKVTAVVEMTTKAVPVKTTTIKEGTVRAVSGSTIIVDEKGKGMKSYMIPGDFKMLVNDQEMTVHDLKPGMVLNATIVSRETKMVTEQELKGAYAAAPPAPKAAAPPPPPAPKAAAPPPPPPPAPAPAPEKKKLPKTASPVPLAGLAGALSLLAGLGVRSLRRSK
ncbi:MAG TPA: hypothetical protein VL084_08360 [Thermoanaerobaculia bacterium]|nr:hypothetical protein [Thermoanaerobaculia bacterium]